MATKTNFCGFLLDEDDMVSDSDIRPPSQQSVKAYADGITSGILTSAEDYADAQDVITLAAAEAYADAQLTAAEDYADSQDAITLTAAEDYADAQDAITLTAANDHSDANDTATLIAANAYTDAEIAALPEAGMNWSGLDFVQKFNTELSTQDGPNASLTLTNSQILTYESVEFLTSNRTGILALVSTTGDETGYKIVRSSDNGLTYTESTTAITTYRVNDMTVLESGMTVGAIDNTGVDNYTRVVGATNWNLGTTPYVLETSEPAVPMSSFCTAQKNGTTLFVGCGETTYAGGYTGAIFYSTNLTSWTKIMSASVSQVLKMAFTSQTSMSIAGTLVTGELGYFSTTNLANQTARIAFAGGPWSRIAALLAVGNNSVIAVLIDSGNNTWFATSTDNGLTFGTPVYFHTEPLTDIIYCGSGMIRATFSDRRYWTINRGRTWVYVTASFASTTTRTTMLPSGRIIQFGASTLTGLIRTHYSDLVNQTEASTSKLGSGGGQGHLQLKGNGWAPGYVDLSFDSESYDGSNLYVKFARIQSLPDCTLTIPSNLINSSYADDASIPIVTRPGNIEMHGLSGGTSLGFGGDFLTNTDVEIRGPLGGTLVELGGDMFTSGDFSTVGLPGLSCALTLQDDTNVTLPTTGTLLTAADLKTRTVNLSPANFRVYDDSADYPLGFVVNSPLTSTDMILHRYADAYGIGYALNQPEASPYYGAACISIPIDGILDNSVPVLFTVDYNTTNLDYDMEIDGTVSAWPDPNEYVISTQSWDPTGGIPSMDKVWTSITFTTAGIKSIFLIVRIKALAEFRTVSIFNIKATYSIV